MMLHDTTTETETAYTDFLVTKRLQDSPSGMDVPLDQISPVLFPFQRALVRWALRRGRAGLFAHTGLGKGLMLLEWAQQVPGEDPVLIVAPLAVTHQLVRESQQKFARAIQYMRHPEEATAHVLVTNYAMMHHFFTLPLSGIVLDESSILKDVGSATLANVLTHFTHVPYRLCCTATPAPNDIAEMANHAEFLGIMKRTDMLSTFFVHDDEGWRLRGHAADAFYRWLASWAMLLRSPADIGFDGRAFVLPPLHIQHHILPSTYRRDGELFASLGLKGITDRAAVRRQVVAEKVARAVELAQQTDGAATIWCELNAESSALASALTPDAVEIVGSASAETKEAGILQFLDGQARLMISKPSICGHGLNLQQAHTAIFVGLTDSFESWFQTIRRHWRFGQTQPVTVHVVLSEHEVAILENVQRKEREVATMLDALIPHLTDLQQEALVTTEQARPQAGLTHHTGPDWNLYEGDCVEGLRHIPDASVGLSVFSPPFLSLYQYSPTERDLGNSRDAESFFTHMRYMADGLMRVTMPGRHVAMHVSQVPAMLVRDGWIGLKDFRGEMVRHMTAWGWIYHGEVVVWKNPQAQAIRIHAKGLAFGQLRKDASWMRPALADYILLFRKPGENPVPILPDISNEDWIKWASPVWMDIRETHTLNAAEAREADDDRHICPLQLDVIERCIRLWSNPGEIICDPFAGIGSTGYVALQHHRRFVGCELKSSYAATARKNLALALTTHDQQSLFAVGD